MCPYPPRVPTLFLSWWPNRILYLSPTLSSSQGSVSWAREQIQLEKGPLKEQPCPLQRPKGGVGEGHCEISPEGGTPGVGRGPLNSDRNCEVRPSRVVSPATGGF